MSRREAKSKVPRPYRQTRRATKTEETRRRIVDAALALHEEIGPARSSIAAVAKRAGVERPTVYRHFPDERSLLAACRGHSLSQHPPPDPSGWVAIEDPDERLRMALSALYAYYAETERLTANLLRDAAVSPAVAEAMMIMSAGLAAAVDLLEVGWPTDEGRAGLVRAALTHAVSFDTWRSLCRRSSLDEGAAIDLIVGMVRSAGESRGPSAKERSG